MIARTVVGLGLVAVPGVVLLSLIDATLGALLVGLLSVLTVLALAAVEWIGAGRPA